ncbi:hypothetical protein ACLNGM_09905 [Aureimonas phyllosphaerae]|uniref:hypothetical protein n=1 Tax=Aureimonas phyllosphaerae TaxID=1166078 RepID=UPI003A5BA625
MASPRRTIDRSTAQPFQPDEDFSQALPEEFDDLAFDQDIRRSFEEAETPSDFLAQAHSTGGNDGRPVAARPAASSVRCMAVEGGYRVEASFPGGQIISDVVPDDASAEIVEQVFGAIADAGTAELARRRIRNIHLDPRLGSARDRAALAAKHAHRA